MIFFENSHFFHEENEYWDKNMKKCLKTAIISKKFNNNFGKVLQIFKRIKEKIQFSMEIYIPI